MHNFKSHFLPPFNEYSKRLNSLCVYHCQKFNGLHLLRPHSQACLTSIGARVASKWLQLACPSKQLAGNHHKTG